MKTCPPVLNLKPRGLSHHRLKQAEGFGNTEGGSTFQWREPKSNRRLANGAAESNVATDYDSEQNSLNEGCVEIQNKSYRQAIGHQWQLPARQNLTQGLTQAWGRR